MDKDKNLSKPSDVRNAPGVLPINEDHEELVDSLVQERVAGTAKKRPLNQPTKTAADARRWCMENPGRGVVHPGGVRAFFWNARSGFWYSREGNLYRTDQGPENGFVYLPTPGESW